MRAYSILVLAFFMSCFMLSVHRGLSVARWAKSNRTGRRLVGFKEGATRILIDRRHFSRMEDHDGTDFDSRVQETYDRVLGMRMIVSESNEKVKLVKNLQLKKRRDKEGLILLEGHRQVIDALRYGVAPRNIFITDKGIDGPMGYSLMEAITFSGEAAGDSGEDLFRKIDVVSDTLMKKCFSEVETAQGLVAAFKRPNRESYLHRIKEKESSSNANALVVFLDHVSDPGNMGTLIRSSFGFGADTMILTGGCDPWSPKVIRSAMGMGLQIPIIETAGWSDQLLDILAEPSPSQMGSLFPLLEHANQDYQILVADMSADATPYYDVDFTKPTMVVVGSEARGPSPEVLGLPNAKKIYIPMARDLESLNAAVAGSVILSEAARQRGSNRV